MDLGEEAIEIDGERRQEVLDQAKSNIIKAQQKQKEAYDKKHSCLEAYKLGAVVLKKNLQERKEKIGGKLDAKWLGPFTIVDSLGRGLYRLQMIGTNNVRFQLNCLDCYSYLYF